MLYANEMLKQDPKNSNLALVALEKDSNNLRHVYLAEKTHKRLIS